MISTDDITKDLLDKHLELQALANKITKTVKKVFQEFVNIHSDIFYLSNVTLSVFGNSCNIFMGINQPVQVAMLLHCYFVKGCSKEIELERFIGESELHKNLFEEVVDKINKETVFDRLLFKKTLESLS